MICKTKRTQVPNEVPMKKSDKVLVIDTNIILNDASAIFSIKNATIVIPQIVIQELDRKKDYADNKSAAYNARAFNRRIKALIKEQKSCELQLASGSILILAAANVEELEKNMKHLGLDNKPDSMIVTTAWTLKQEGQDVRVVTNDVNMWVTCTSLEIDVEDYEENSKPQDLYSGVKVIELEETELINRVYSGEDVIITEDEFPGLYPNQIIVFKSQASRHSSLIVMFKGYKEPLFRVRDMKKLQLAGTRPLNKEQGFAMELLSDDNIPCVTLAGRAGTGKSIIALSYGVANLNSMLDKIIVLKPVVPVGRDLGFLPGTLEEKLLPWIESFKDSLDIIFKSGSEVKDGFDLKEKTYDYLVENGMLEFQPLSFMRGRSIQNTLIILDEAQNCSVHEIKTLLTRVGEGSKLIALGDVEQIDAPWLSHQNNGLTHLIERGKDSELVGHVTFIKSHRSPLADWASLNL